MPALLEKIVFEKEHLRATAEFDCGAEPWEVEVSDWIRGRGQESVLDYLPLPDCQIWLYTTPEFGLVGFGSIKATRWRWPTPRDRAITLTMIPMLGIQSRFRGEPHGEGERRYSEQLLDDLAFEATSHRDREPLLGLYVHPGNARAISFYRRSGFSDFPKSWIDPHSGVAYQAMLLDLRQFAETSSPEAC